MNHWQLDRVETLASLRKDSFPTLEAPPSSVTEIQRHRFQLQLSAGPATPATWCIPGAVDWKWKVHPQHPLQQIFSLVHPQENILTLSTAKATCFVGSGQNPFNLAAEACKAPQQPMFPPTQAQVWGEHVLATSREDRTSVTILPSIKCIRALIRLDQVGSGWPCNNSFRRFSLHIWWARLVHNGWTTQHLRRYKTWCLGHVWNLKEIERIEWAGPIVNHSFLRSIFPKCFGRYRMSKSCERCCTFCYMWWDLQVYQWVDNPSYGRPAATPPQPYVQVGQLCHLCSLFQFVLFESSLWQIEDANHSRSLEFDFGRIFRDVLQAAPTNPYYPGKVHVACGDGEARHPQHPNTNDMIENVSVLTWCFANSGRRFAGVCPVSWGVDPYGVPRPMDRSCSVTVCFWWLVFTFLRAR